MTNLHSPNTSVSEFRQTQQSPVEGTQKLRLADIVAIDAEFKPSVQLPNDFEHPELNAHLIKSYIPTSDSIALFEEIAQSLNPNSTDRARTLVGTYGTGKSDLLLMICNYLSRPVDDPVMQPFYQRLKALDSAKHDIIRQQRANKPPFLIVLLQADSTTPFTGFVLHGLNQALERHGLADMMAKTKYAAAREQIVHWQATEHPLFQTFYQHMQDIEGKEIAGLLAELDSSQADLVFPTFLRAFQKVTGTDFNVYGYSKPHETFTHVARTLRERGDYSGMLLVCDEFTEFLRRFEHAIDQQASDIDSETIDVQNVAERSTSSGPAQLHFLVASLESFAAAATESKSGQASKAIERVGGRFIHHSLAIQAGEELIKGTIRRIQPDVVVLPNRQRDTLLDIATPIWKQHKRSREWVRDTIVDGTFPLHPLTTYALPLINRQVAQSQRTMFQFLQSDEGLLGFVKSETLTSNFPDWHTLLTLDVLFDYFQDSIATKKPELADAYNQALQSLHTSNVNTHLAERVLKVVTFCEVVVPDPVLPATRTVLQQTLNLPPEASDDLQSALTLLEQVEAVYPPETEDGIYRLPLQGRISVQRLRRQVREESRRMAASVDALQREHPAEAVKAKGYNQKRGSHRALTACYVDVETLNKPAQLRKDLDNAPDALLWYVVVSNDMERATAQSAAREYTKQKQYAHFVIAVPNAPLDILHVLKDYAALTKVRESPDTESEAKAYLQDNGLIGREYRARLNKALETLRDVRQWEWFVNGSSTATRVQDQPQLYELASKLMEKLFKYTPKHTLSQHFKPGSPSSSVKKAVESIIKGEVQIAKSSRGASEHIMRVCVASFGVLKYDRNEGAYEVYVPSVPDAKHFDSKKVWDVLYTNFLEGKSWATIAETLRKPPYGLYDSILLVYLAVFMTYYADSIELAHNKAIAGRPSVDLDLLTKLLAHPKEYTITFLPLTDAEQRWLRGIVEHGLQQKLAATTTHGKSLKASVVEHVLTWIKKRKLPLWSEQMSLETLGNILPDIPSETLAIALVLIQTKQEQDLTACLMDDIPQRLGAPSDHSQWNETHVHELITRFAEVCRIMEALPGSLLQYAENRIATLFGCADTPPDQRWNDIYAWRQKKHLVKPHKLPSSARTLFLLINEPRGSIEQTILSEYAKNSYSIAKEYRHWPTLDSLTTLEQEIQQALEDIENHWKEAASGEEIWLSGLANAVSGQTQINVSSQQDVADALVDWYKAFSWPSCTTTISLPHLKHVYQDLDPLHYQDIAYLLQRISYDSSQWESEMNESLAKHFGIEHWHKEYVQQALARFTAALQHAAQFETLLRQHVLTTITSIFAGAPWSPGPQHQPTINNVVAQWYTAHTIPEHNDLSDDARTLLSYINPESESIETVLLSTLPCALASIGQAYQQWPTYKLFERYRDMVQRIVKEINAYKPLTDAEHAWLTGIVTHALQKPFLETAWEKQRVVSIVTKYLHEWLDARKLPAFSTTLQTRDLQDLFPKFQAYCITAGNVLLGSPPSSVEQRMTFLLHALPVSLGQERASTDWDDNDVHALLEHLSQACWLIQLLQQKLKNHLYTALGHVFGMDAQDDDKKTLGALVVAIQQWRDNHIVLSNEQLSPNARTLYDLMQTIEHNPETVILFKLPSKIREVHMPYQQWPTWEIHTTYVVAIQQAAQEIEQRAKVREATEHVRHVFEQFKQQFYAFSDDEQRWILQALKKELLQ